MISVNKKIKDHEMNIDEKIKDLGMFDVEQYEVFNFGCDIFQEIYNIVEEPFDSVYFHLREII